MHLSHLFQWYLSEEHQKDEIKAVALAPELIHAWAKEKVVRGRTAEEEDQDKEGEGHQVTLRSLYGLKEDAQTGNEWWDHQQKVDALEYAADTKEDSELFESLGPYDPVLEVLFLPDG